MRARQLSFLRRRRPTILSRISVAALVEVSLDRNRRQQLRYDELNQSKPDQFREVR